jgi:hypothetical protein
METICPLKGERLEDVRNWVKIEAILPGVRGQKMWEIGLK